MSTSLKKFKIERIINHCVLHLAKSEDTEIRFVKIAEGVKLPVLILENNVCKLINKKQFMQIAKTMALDLYENFKDSIGNPESFLLTAITAGQLFDTAEVHPKLQLKEKVKPFCFLSDPSFTFCRLPFDPAPGVPVPNNWALFLDNFTNREAVCMWIGSLFFPNSDKSQYLWLYGKGGNGKSTLARVISSLLGDFVRYEQAPAKDDKYWTSGLIGKRLIVLDDCNHYGFVKTGLFKSLTGGSKVRVEVKFGNPYDTDLDCKFLFTSNEIPLISDEIADQRRIIFSSALNKQKFGYDADFEAGLRETLPDFISYCMELYSASCADGRPIPVDAKEAEAIAEVFDEDVEAWLESIGEFKEGALASVSDFRNAMAQTKLNPRAVYRVLEKRGVLRGTSRRGDQVFKCLKGFSLKAIFARF